MKKLLMILLCFLFSAGCAAVQNERRVDGNVFYSSHLPKLTMSVDNSFKYIGEQKGKKKKYGPKYGQGSAGIADISAYPFVKVKGKVVGKDLIQQMLIIMVMKFEDPGSAVRPLDVEKEIKVGVKKYKAFAAILPFQDWVLAYPIEFLLNSFLLQCDYVFSSYAQSDYVLSSYYGGMVLSRILSKDTWMEIVYLEKVSRHRPFFEYKETVFKRGLKAFEIIAEN